MESGIKEKIKSLSEQHLEEAIAVRRHLHMHPELSFHEYDTCAYVWDRLDQIGVTHKRKLANTGIEALIQGKNPSSRTIALRADMDALPILEQNQVPYKSMNEGVMHACGHDAHTASLLGAAFILQNIRDDFEGTVKVSDSGRRMAQGICPVCGTKVNRILGKAQ